MRITLLPLHEMSIDIIFYVILPGNKLLHFITRDAIFFKVIFFIGVKSFSLFSAHASVAQKGATMKRASSILFRLVFSAILIALISKTAAAQPALSEMSQQGAQQIVLKMTQPANYKVFHLQNPPRLIVYIYGSGIQTKKMETKCYGDYIKYAKIYPFSGNYGTVRLEIGIAEGLEYREWTVDNNIYLWVGKPSEAPPPPPPPPDTGEEPAATAETPMEPIPPETAEITGRTVMLSTRYITRPKTAPRASKLLDIIVTAGDEITRVIINTNGPVHAFDDFLLVNPNRLAIDIFNVKADYVKPRLQVISSALSVLRWGTHRDRIRVVMDLAATTGPAPYYKTGKIDSGIEILIYSTGAISQAPASYFKTHTVTEGENLRDIARKVYGDSRAWRRIVSFNRDKFADPDEILKTQGNLYPQAGTVLKLPIR